MLEDAPCGRGKDALFIKQTLTWKLLKPLKLVGAHYIDKT